MHYYGSLCFAKPPKMENLQFRRLKCFLKGKSLLCGLQYLKFKFSSCSGQGKPPAKALPQYNGIDRQIPNVMEVSAGQKCSFSVLFRNCSEMDFVRRKEIFCSSCKLLAEFPGLYRVVFTPSISKPQTACDCPWVGWQ